MFIQSKNLGIFKYLRNGNFLHQVPLNTFFYLITSFTVLSSKYHQVKIKLSHIGLFFLESGCKQYLHQKNIKLKCLTKAELKIPLLKIYIVWNGNNLEYLLKKPNYYYWYTYSRLRTTQPIQLSLFQWTLGLLSLWNVHWIWISNYISQVLMSFIHFYN